jgi:hypothetical protein
MNDKEKLNNQSINQSIKRHPYLHSKKKRKHKWEEKVWKWKTKKEQRKGQLVENSINLVAISSTISVITLKSNVNLNVIIIK